MAVSQLKLERDGETLFAALQMGMVVFTFLILLPIRAMACCGVDRRFTNTGFKPLFSLLCCELVQFMLADGTTIFIWGRTDEDVFDNNDWVSQTNAIMSCVHGCVIAVAVMFCGAVYVASKIDVSWQAFAVTFWVVFGGGPVCALAVYYGIIVGDLLTVKHHGIDAIQEALLGIYVTTILTSALLAWGGMLSALQHRELACCCCGRARADDVEEGSDGNGGDDVDRSHAGKSNYDDDRSHATSQSHHDVNQSFMSATFPDMTELPGNTSIISSI
jgi:hypothetical protein